MKVTRKIVLSVIGAAGLAVASTGASAHPGWQGGMGRGMAPGMMGGMGPCSAAAADTTAACPMAGAGLVEQDNARRLAYEMYFSASYAALHRRRRRMTRKPETRSLVI